MTEGEYDGLCEGRDEGETDGKSVGMKDGLNEGEEEGSAQKISKKDRVDFTCRRFYLVVVDWPFGGWVIKSRVAKGVSRTGPMKIWVAPSPFALELNRHGDEVEIVQIVEERQHAADVSGREGRTISSEGVGSSSLVTSFEVHLD